MHPMYQLWNKNLLFYVFPHLDIFRRYFIYDQISSPLCHAYYSLQRQNYLMCKTNGWWIYILLKIFDTKAAIPKKLLKTMARAKTWILIAEVKTEPCNNKSTQLSDISRPLPDYLCSKYTWTHKIITNIVPYLNFTNSRGAKMFTIKK